MRRLGLLGLLGLTVPFGLGCESCGSDGVHHLPDAPPPPDAVDGPLDAFVPTGGAMIVAQSPPGPQNGDPSTWQGALAFKIAADGAPALAITGIAATSLHDPADVVFRAASSEVLVGNRHGNNSADGVSGSISRFLYDPITQAFTPGGEILGNGLAGVHQLAFDPVTGELFAANVNAGVSRFTFAQGGSATPAGTISSGPTRGVAVAPDGKRLYVSTAANVIRQFALPGGTELAATTIPSTATLHYFALRQGQLYVAALDDNKVYRFQLAADDSLSALPSIDAQAPIAVAFSESGLEMFVTGHRTSNLVMRYRYAAATDSWEPTTELALPSSLGGVSMLPIR
ncbi:MAG: hypothetical protein IPQ07_44130 [Myxococcales bacterium]|nr:hypothetical protein [Myxococcales bacterium]